MTHRRTEKPTIEMWTDGSVRPNNPGPHGGWGVVLRMQDGDRVRYRALSGYIGQSTNQRAELTALLFGLKALSYPCVVQLRADSTYVMGKIKAIKKNPNKQKYGSEKNMDLYMTARPYILMHSFESEHVYGHSDVELNEWADALAYNATVTRQGTDEYYEEVPAFRRLKVFEEE